MKDIERQEVSTMLVKAQLVPRNGDVFTSIDNWVFQAGHTMLPYWFLDNYAGQKVVDAVKEWAEEHIHIGKVGLTLSQGTHYIKDCRDVTLSCNVRVKEVRGNTSILEMCDESSILEIYDNSIVHEMHDKSEIQIMYDNSTVRLMYNSAVIGAMFGDAIVQEMYGSSSVNSMYLNSTIQGMRDSSKVEIMHDDSTVQEMCGDSIIETMHDNSTVHEMWNQSIATACSCHYVGKPESLVLSGNAVFRDLKNEKLYYGDEIKSVQK